MRWVLIPERKTQSHRHASRAPIAALLFENAGDFVTARSATAVFKIPLTELVPIALDEQLTATGTPRATAIAIVDISSVNVMQTFRARDLSRARKRRRGRMRFIKHLEIRMKCREMPRHIRPQIFDEPFRRAMQFVVAVVLAGDQQRRDFE